MIEGIEGRDGNELTRDLLIRSASVPSSSVYLSAIDEVIGHDLGRDIVKCSASGLGREPDLVEVVDLYEYLIAIEEWVSSSCGLCSR